MPSAKVIFDSEAIDFPRSAAKRRYLGISYTQEQTEEELENEMFLYKVANKNIVVSTRELELLENISPELAKKTLVLTPNPAHVNISAGGVAKYATNKAEAIKLLEYLASPKGSKGIAAPTFEHPLKEVNQNPIVKDFGEFTPDKVTVEELGVNNALAIKLMKDAGWD